MSFFTYLHQIFTGQHGQTTRGTQQGFVATRSLPLSLPRNARSPLSHTDLLQFSAHEGNATAVQPVPVNRQVADLDAKLSLIPQLRDLLDNLHPGQMMIEMEKQLEITPEEKGLIRCGMDPAAILDVVVRRLEEERIAARAICTNPSQNQTA